MTDGKMIITRLNDSDESLRCKGYLGKEYLNKLVKLIVMNSLMSTKLSMLGEKGIVKVNTAGSMNWLPCIDIQSKPN